MTELSTDILFSLDPENGIKQLYDKSIQLAQKGKHDNILKRLRFYALHQLAAQAVVRFPRLSVAECGCWKGHSTHILASILAREPNFTGKFHIFDSFEGLSEFHEYDISDLKPPTLERRRHFRSNLKEFLSGISRHSFILVHPGWIPLLFGGVEEETFSFVSIDVDLYEPTKEAIDFFYQRLHVGGIMYFDDYGYKTFPGATRAVEQFRKTITPSFFLALPAGGAFLIK